ncbi:MAG TPA: sulfatase-like hydrolase/transferase [Polyangiaceae bacterium]|nr:sulfatase-like hydrolase/transferase [Polyangiaceae bacterium]
MLSISPSKDLMPSPTSQPSPWPAFLTIGLLLTTINIAAILSAALAWCIAGQFRWIVALTGAFGNITPGLLFTTLLFVWLHKRKALFFISLGLLFVVQTITTITCTEFMLQRGAPIAPIDVLNGLDAGFLNSQLGVLTSSHVGPYLALSIAVFALSLSLLHRQWIPIPRQGILIVLAVLGTFILLSLGIHRTDRGKHALRPYDRLLGALVTTNHLNIIVGLEPALKKQNVTDSSALPALAMIGLPIQHCPDGLHVAEPITQSSKNTLVYNRLYELGIHLGGRGRPLSLLVIMLESVGAEDIACLDAGAPHGLTPYLDDLIQRTPHVLVGKRFHQGGQRTAGAMSSLLCGVGTGPFGIAPLRDLPGLKLRCWPDLVAEAGGDLRFFYADNLRFDRYDETLLEHGFRYLHTPRTQGRARGAWGLSDQELFADVLADLAQTSAGITPQATRIRGVLTLSTHGPFDIPQDMPADLRDRSRDLVHKSTQDSVKRAHWTTVAYLDHALSRFIPAFMQAEEKSGRTAVVMMVGDHTSGVGTTTNPLQRSRIAPIWVFPSDTDVARVTSAQRELDAHGWSQNDLPRMLVAFLDGFGALRSLAPSQRWHTLGGQAMSPTFAIIPPWSDTHLWTIDTLARSRMLDASDEIIVEEIAESPGSFTDLETSTKAMDKALPALSWMLQHPDRLHPCANAPAPASSAVTPH